MKASHNNFLHVFDLTIKQTTKLIEKLKSGIDNKIEARNSAKHNFNPIEQLLKLTVILTMCAFLYWRIFFENFGIDYFIFCFALEDAPFILYYKGTYYTYGLILILFFAWPYLLNIINRHLRFLTALTILAIFSYLLVRIEQFTIIQGIVFFLALTAVMIIYLAFDNNAIFYAFVIVAFYIAISANNDVKNVLKNPMYITLESKDGKTILDKSQRNRFVLTATSKFIIIYDQKNKIVEKYNRDELK